MLLVSGVMNMCCVWLMHSSQAGTSMSTFGGPTVAGLDDGDRLAVRHDKPVRPAPPEGVEG